MIAQTPVVIIGESVVAALIAALITFLIRRAIIGSPRDAAVSATKLVGGNATSSPIAVGGTVHQSNFMGAVTVQEAPSAPLERDSSPTPEDVSSFHRDLNPYQRTQSRNQHRGITVHWRLAYKSLVGPPSASGDVSVFAKSAPSKGNVWGEDVVFRISLNEWPAFKIAPMGRVFWLDGTIGEIAEGAPVIIHVDATGIKWEADEGTRATRG